MTRLIQTLRRRINGLLLRCGIRVLRLSEADRRYLGAAHQSGGPAPVDAAAVLRADNPALQDLRRRYATREPVLNRGRRWGSASVERYMDLRNFRGDSLYMWHYRESEPLTRLRFYVYLRYLMDRDGAGLLRRLSEDGAFGCWTFSYPGLPTVSRDLLDSINELHFLDQHLGVLNRPGLRVLDIGAGYGRLAHRFVTAAPTLADYCCIDAVPESTFLSDYYIAFRNCSPRARVVPLDQVEALATGSFDVAVNIHSFPECPYQAIAWWAGQLQRLRVPNLLIVPNDGERLLSSEPDGTRRAFDDLFAAAGYRRVHAEPVIADPAARELTGIRDAFVLFRLEGSRG